MELFTTKTIGKTFFWISFILGNICLFGYYLTKNEDFALAGFLLLVFGGIINLIAFLGLILYGIFYKKHYDDCLKSALIILINIPIAAFYAWIGINYH